MQPPKLPVSELALMFPQFHGLNEIGCGGFKTVYKGDVNGAPEVLKVISIPAPDDPNQVRFQEECVARVRREVAILGRCHSPSLVKLASVGLQDWKVNGYTYCIYSEEYLEGSDLWKLIKNKRALPTEAEAKQLMRSLLLAVQEIWSMRYIHRDIKPANIIKTSDPTRQFVLIDLGIAFGLMESRLTAPGGVMCTTRYLAPEMVNPNFQASIDYRADLYTSALTVFEYASGQHPIARDSDDQIRTMTRALHQPPRALGDLRPDFSDSFCKLIDQLLKKTPALRPANLNSLISQINS